MKILKIIGCIILAIAVIVGLLWGIPALRMWDTNVDRAVFKESVTYNEEASQFLMTSYKDYNEATTEQEKNIIINYITMRYPNLDSSKIENLELRQFYNMCVGGGN